MARGLISNPAGTQLAMVIGDTVYSIASDGVRTSIGSLMTRRGTVGMKLGINQFVIVDGSNGYTYDMRTGVFEQITDPGWRGSYTVENPSGYFSFIDPNTQEWYISSLDDARTFDPLQYEVARLNPDKLVGQATLGGQNLILFGETSAEVWQNVGAADFPFQRNNGAFIEVGLLGAHTLKDLDNSLYWLGRDQRGAGMVYKLEGFRAVRISTMAIEEVIQQAIRDGEDMSEAVAYAYQQDGHSFYVLQVPGLDTTWVYDASTGQWHERAELVRGDYAQHRGRYHAYAFGKHLITGDDDQIYEYDPLLYTNAGDVLVRDRISPHMATPGLDRLTFSRFELDCTVGFGKAGQSQANVMMRTSNDGGHDWGSWRTATLGAVGEKTARARFLRCGTARDRVWHVRCSDDTPFAIVNAVIEAT